LIKKELSYKKKKAAVIILSSMTVISAVSLIVFGIIGIKVNKTEQTASYSTKSEINYNLELLNDPYYNKNVIDFGVGYVTKLVNSIDLTFDYSFDSSKAKNISGSYSAKALLEATYNSTNIIWRKEIQLVPQTAFKTGQTTCSLNLPLTEYMELAKNLQLNTGLTTAVKATITYTVNASAEVDGNPVDQISESTLIFPVTGDVIIMDGKPVDQQTKAVENAVLKEVLPKKLMLIVSIVLLVLFGGGLFYLVMFTLGVRTDPIELELNKIYKKYNSRIVELRPENQLEDCETAAVKSFRDLLLVADERKEPIFKNSCANFMDTEFYVFDKLKKYIFKARFLTDIYQKKEKPKLDNFSELVEAYNKKR
jgi:hypothetical protein